MLKLKFFLLFLSFAQLAIARQFTSDSKTLVLATYQYADNPRVENLKPLAERLKNSTGLEVLVKSYPTVFALIEAMQKKAVDVALISTFGYFLMEGSIGTSHMRPVATFKMATGAINSYKTAFVVPAGETSLNFNQISETASNLRMAFVAKGSTSGNLVPRLLFSGIGIQDAEKQFKTVEYAGTHRAAIEQVASGNADLAAMGSVSFEEYQKKSGNESKVRLLQMSDEIPLGPVVVSEALSLSTIDAIETELIHLHLKSPAAFLSVRNAWSEAMQSTQFVLIKSHFYDDFKAKIGSASDFLRVLRQFVGG